MRAREYKLNKAEALAEELQKTHEHWIAMVSAIAGSFVKRLILRDVSDEEFEVSMIGVKILQRVIHAVTPEDFVLYLGEALKELNAEKAGRK